MLKKQISPNLWRPAIYPAGASFGKAGHTRRLVPFDEQLQNTKCPLFAAGVVCISSIKENNLLISVTMGKDFKE